MRVAQIKTLFPFPNTTQAPFRVTRRYLIAPQLILILRAPIKPPVIGID